MEQTQETTITTPAPQEAPAEKTFSQAEVDTIVARRLAKAQKGMPSEEELTAFRAWKDTQQTEAQRMEALTQERDTARSDLAEALARVEQYERERIMLAKGIPAEDVDYYVYKAGKLVGDTKTFEQAADEIIRARAPQQATTRVDFGAPLNGGKATMTVDEIMAIQDDAKRQKAIAENHTLFGF